MFADISHFVLSFAARWFILMSGGPSVPLAIAAFLVENKTAQTWLCITAVFCFILASFFVWREEYRKVATLRRKLLPVISISISGSGVAEDVDHAAFYTKRVQVMVQGTTTTLLIECQTRLVCVERLHPNQEGAELLEEPLRVEWSNVDEVEKFGKITIPPGIQQRANLFGIHKQGGPLFPIVSHYKQQLFDHLSDPGQYIVIVAVSAKDVLTAKETFILEWKDYDNISLTQAGRR
jgi:hypothetical protein